MNDMQSVSLTEKIEQIKKWLGTGSINIFGKPFAGKDTQAKRLAEKLDAILIGGGDILRNSVIPKRSKEALERGELIPSDDYVDIVLPYLSRDDFKKSPLVLSSVGRWHGEENGVIRSLEESNHDIKLVIYLSITDEVCKNRYNALKINDDRSRDDDTNEILQTRLFEYQSKTIPVIEYYRSADLLIEIDGNKSRDEIEQDILESLYQIASSL